MVARLDWSVWIFARGSTNSFVSFYIIYLLFIYQTRWIGLVAGDGAGNTRDLGSNPRSALFFTLFFHRNSCAFSMSRHSVHLHNPVIHASWEIKSKAGIQRTRCTLVNAQHATQKKSTRPCSSGPDCWVHTSIWGLPPWFAILFIFLIILFSWLFTLINYFYKIQKYIKITP